MDYLKSINHFFSAVFCFLILFSHSVAASNIGVSSQSESTTSFLSNENSTNDILTVANKNEKSISFNYFNTFNVIDKPLVIYNGTQSLDDEVSTHNGIKTIVLVADQINLQNTIQVIGAPADLLILSSNGQDINCINCRFINAGRVTLANAAITNANTIGDLQTGTSGNINVNNLSAPGLQSLELIAANVITNGVIDINLRADNHPQGGMIITENGTEIIGAGGVNIYSGNLTINYNELKIKSADKTQQLTINSQINAASIAITSPNKIVVSKKLNTLSSALSTSTRFGEFYSPLEGIFITTLQEETSESIYIQNQLTTDHSISLKSSNSIDLHSSSYVLSPSIEFLALDTVKTSGTIQATEVTISAGSNLTKGDYINTGTITTRDLDVDVDNNIFNSFGGRIKAKKIVLKAINGYVINGSRSKYINYTPSALSLIIDPTSTTFGIKSDSAIPTTGTALNNLSAHITANNLHIDAKYVENINPYIVSKSINDNWDSSITINNANANRVTMQAEAEFYIKASQYIVNASAIMALNQEGEISINTPKFNNERYHITFDSFKSNQVIYSSDNAVKFEALEQGIVTKITNYSPPGRLISFGDFRFSDGNNDGVKSEFNSLLSYTEVFQNAYFHQSNLELLSLELSSNITLTHIDNITNCLISLKCQQTEIETNAEAEAVFSIQGNLYGIDESEPSLSDVNAGNLSVYSIEVQNAVLSFLNGLLPEASNLNRTHHIKEYDILGDQLSYTLNIYCGIRLAGLSRRQVYGCETIKGTQSITELLNVELENEGFEGTAYTYNELRDAANLYIDTLSMKSTRVDAGISTNTQYVVINISPFFENELVELDVQEGSNNTIINIIYNENLQLIGFSYFGRSDSIPMSVTHVQSVSVSTLATYIP